MAMAEAMRRGVRIDRHAADRVDDGAGGLVGWLVAVVVAAVLVHGGLRPIPLGGI
jgi:hypothetical protein